MGGFCSLEMANKSLLHTKIIHVIVRDMQALRRSVQVELIF